MDTFRITPLGVRTFDMVVKEKCTLDQAIWGVQKEDGVSLLGRIYERIKGFLIKLKYTRRYYEWRNR